MTPYISYKTAKMLHDFLGKAAPEPMGDYYFHEEYDQIETIEEWRAIGVEQSGLFPAYRLEDLLSREFCEAMAKFSPDRLEEDPLGTREIINMGKPEPNDISKRIYYAYYFGRGLPAVELALAEMIGGEK